jgi:aspartate carbamoyltransferase catalytic subunit
MKPWTQALISVDQFTPEDIKRLFSNTHHIDTSAMVRPLTGKLLCNLFYEPSTRTSSSFHSAMVRLGGSVIPINEVAFSSVTKGETLEDTVQTLAEYVDIITLRHPENDATERAAEVCRVPIINAGNGTGEHPTQALLDLYTIWREKGRLSDLTITFMGDLKYGRTVHSLVKLLRMYDDIRLRFVSPRHLRLPVEHRDKHTVEVTDIRGVVDDTDVLYITRTQWERAEGNMEFSRPEVDYRLTPAHMARAKDDMILMHPLPRTGELPKIFDNDPRSVYFKQVANGLKIRKALLATMLHRI